MADDETLPAEDPGETVAADDRPVAAGVLPVEGDRVGRYEVRGKLGAGAMGVVLHAHDPELDRKVAIKLLKPRQGGDGTAGRARLQREAQALARLSHNNVVGVYDVGKHDTFVYVAMEFVDGGTLGAWMETRRPWREVVQVFLAAGEGLAAAHAVDLIHRDFKPDNVMMEAGGRVRVMDFGLARSTDGEEEAAVLMKTGAYLGGDALSTPLTMTGAVMGTPAYMSPEQFAGVGADARSDQFSFCVALYEALYGERPFAGESIPAISLAVTTGKIRPAPRDSDVPRWVRDVVVRGLSPDADARWASMPALLAGLRADPAIKRRKWAAVAGVAVLLGGTAYGVREASVTELAPEVSCAQMVALPAKAWNAGVAKELRAGFEASGDEGWEKAHEETVRSLDAYARDWRASRIEACEAERVPDPPPDVRLRIVCLDRRAQHLVALTSLLNEEDADVTSDAARMVKGLPKIERCSDPDALRVERPLPEDPDLARAVLEIEALLARVDALQAGRRHTEALVVADQALEREKVVGYPPLRVEALNEKAHSLVRLDQWAEAAEHAETAYPLALEHQLPLDASRAASSLLSTLKRLDRPDEARRYEELAMVHARASGSAGALASVMNNVGAARFAEGDLDGAQKAFEDAIEAYRAAHGEYSPKQVNALYNLVTLANAQGKLEDGLPHLERAVAIYRRSGSVSGLTTALGNVAVTRSHLGLHDEARDLDREVLGRLEAEYGPENNLVVPVLVRLAVQARNRSEWEEARVHLTRALPLQEKSLPPHHAKLAVTHLYLADTERELGRYEIAVELIDRVSQGAFSEKNADHHLLLRARLERAKVDLDSGKANARADLEALEAELSRLVSESGETEIDDRTVTLADTRIWLALALVSGARVTGRDRARAAEVGRAGLEHHEQRGPHASLPLARARARLEAVGVNVPDSRR